MVVGIQGQKKYLEAETDCLVLGYEYIMANRKVMVGNRCIIIGSGGSKTDPEVINIVEMVA